MERSTGKKRPGSPLGLRPPSDPGRAPDEQLRRLRRKVGGLTMDNELLEEPLRRLGDIRGPRSQRSRR